jgi:hypothetical protein
MRGFLADLYAMSWQDRLFTLALIVPLFTLGFPLIVWFIASFRWNLWWHLRGSTTEAWARCAPSWSQSRNALGGEVGPNLETPFVHSLAAHFGRYHPDARAFLTERLFDPDPYLAAYAFKCLTRFDPLSMEDIPKEVLDRDEIIDAQRWGCFVDRLTLGQYMHEYFLLTQNPERDGPALPGHPPPVP